MPPVMLAPVLGVIVNTIGVPAGADVGVAEKVDSALAPTLTRTVPAVAPPADTVTVAVPDVVSVGAATPLASVIAVAGFREPASVLKFTGIPAMPEPPSSVTSAEIVDVPPVEPIVCGDALTCTRLAAAVPIFSCSDVDAPPE